ncbi:MAG: hypothetical protein LBK54_05120 [Propionibacteriaceae bacterium]|jgi:hypothetical protein|nr:hypothetical protein [Propionibacteriaceae bacterium]
MSVQASRGRPVAERTEETQSASLPAARGRLGRSDPVASGGSSARPGSRASRGGLGGWLVALGLAVGGLAGGAQPALAAPLPAHPVVPALPPDGAGADTPGTASSVWPTSLAPCATINFSVSGYPAGETVYVKIDDGIGYGDTSVQGSGVWHSQAIPNSGRVSGSFELPCDITPGEHWLRFLASAYVDPSDPNKGVIGFTRRGGADFIVVAAGSGGNTGSGNAGAGSGSAAGPEAGAVTGQGAEQVGGPGGVLGIDPGLVPDSSASPAGSPAAGATGPTSSPEPTDGLIAPPATARSQPRFGLIGAAVVVLAAGAAAALVWRRGRARTGAGPRESNQAEGPAPGGGSVPENGSALGDGSGPEEKPSSGDVSGPADGPDPGRTPDPGNGPDSGNGAGSGESLDDQAGPGTSGL